MLRSEKGIPVISHTLDAHEIGIEAKHPFPPSITIMVEHSSAHISITHVYNGDAGDETDPLAGKKDFVDFISNHSVQNVILQRTGSEILAELLLQASEMAESLGKDMPRPSLKAQLAFARMHTQNLTDMALKS